MYKYKLWIEYVLNVYIKIYGLLLCITLNPWSQSPISTSLTLSCSEGLCLFHLSTCLVFTYRKGFRQFTLKCPVGWQGLVPLSVLGRTSLSCVRKRMNLTFSGLRIIFNLFSKLIFYNFLTISNVYPLDSHILRTLACVSSQKWEEILRVDSKYPSYPS